MNRSRNYDSHNMLNMPEIPLYARTWFYGRRSPPSRATAELSSFPHLETDFCPIMTRSCNYALANILGMSEFPICARAWFCGRRSPPGRATAKLSSFPRLETDFGLIMTRSCNYALGNILEMSEFPLCAWAWFCGDRSPPGRRAMFFGFPAASGDRFWPDYDLQLQL